MRWIRGGVTAARGFAASGISGGIKRSRRPDLALVVSDRLATASAVFTANRLQAAPVIISRQRVRHGRARAVLLNSGCANCLTGVAGLRDARRLGRAAAAAVGVAEREVLLASTGLIGTRLPVSRIERSLPRLAAGLSRASHEEAAWAILTTDRRPKEAAVTLSIGGRPVRVGGMAKGAGMIAPSMATMLAVITTDAAAPAAVLRRLLREAVDASFNCISVDGDMSTNDTVLLLANGAAGVSLRAGSRATRQVAVALRVVAERLARMIVEDGEGAKRVLEVIVRGARTAREARACAQKVIGSPLVKTMVAGADPNVGRVAAAVGASGAQMRPGALEITLQGQRVVARGRVVPDAQERVRQRMRRPQVQAVIHLHAGRASARMWTCDLTTEYVRINAGYTT